MNEAALKVDSDRRIKKTSCAEQRLHSDCGNQTVHHVFKPSKGQCASFLGSAAGEITFFHPERNHKWQVAIKIHNK